MWTIYLNSTVEKLLFHDTREVGGKLPWWLSVCINWAEWIGNGWLRWRGALQRRKVG